MIRNILLSLLIFIAATSAVHAAAAEQSFSERKANLAEVNAIRVGYGSGTVRLVIDMTKKVDFVESYVENPSRLILDLQNSWLSPNVAKEIELKSLAAKKVRVAQFNPSTVRIVIESMADIKPFHLPGGPKGHRFVIDIGNVEFKENPDLNKPDDTALKEQQERELQEQRERELQAQRERELQAQRERELQAQRERELQAQRERELQAQRERELQAQRERELQAQRERELQERQEREIQDQREREKQLEKDRKEKLEREMKEQREREKQLEKERKEKLEREMKEQREREKQLEKERKEREKQERREKKEREKKERDSKNKDKKDLDDDKKEVDKPFTDLDNDLGDITALKGKKIVIDPGHGGNDSGAIGPTGVMEKNVTLNVALELKKLLVAEGATVVMTRETDTTVSSKGAAASDIEELGARCEVANRINADIFISIHADSFTRPEARGTTGYYYSKGSGAGQRLADAIRRNLVEQLGTPSRGTQPCNFYVVRHTDMPATLIELGFISNKDEERLLNSAEGVIKAAQGILDGIEDYFG